MLEDRDQSSTARHDTHLDTRRPIRAGRSTLGTLRCPSYWQPKESAVRSWNTSSYSKPAVVGSKSGHGAESAPITCLLRLNQRHNAGQLPYLNRESIGAAVMLPSPTVLEQRILSMKPEHETRRKIIREWMSLPKDKRQTEDQAKPFAKKAMERIPSSGDPYRQIMSWLLPRLGKPWTTTAVHLRERVGQRRLRD